MNRRRQFPARMLALAGSVLLAAEATGAPLLVDEFTQLDPARWSVESNGGGSAWVAGDNLVVRSGTVNGGGAWVRSLPAFRPDEHESLTVECRARVATPWTGGADLWSCALARVAGRSHYYVAIGVIEDTGELRAAVQDGPASSRVSTPIVGYDATEWHDYRIVIRPGRADFHVDGTLAASLVTPNVPADQSMFVRLDRGSPGFNDFLFVDRVVVGDASPVPVRPTSWARLKALARTSP